MGEKEQLAWDLGSPPGRCSPLPFTPRRKSQELSCTSSHQCCELDVKQVTLSTGSQLTSGQMGSWLDSTPGWHGATWAVSAQCGREDCGRGMGDDGQRRVDAVSSSSWCP